MTIEEGDEHRDRSLTIRRSVNWGKKTGHPLIFQH